MSKERTPNPHFGDTPQRRAWAAGYAAALSDAAGIAPAAKRDHGLGKFMFPR